MSNPTFNKYKSTTIFGNLSVKDLTNSAGSSVVEVASVDLSGNFLSRGDSTFTKAIVCNALLADINANNKLTTKEYVDSAVGGGSILGTNNTFIGTNIFNNNVDVSGNSTFNNFFPTSTLASGTAVTNDSIPNKGKNDTLYSSITNEVKNNTANSFTSTNSFNSFFPTSTLASGTAVTNDSIPNKGINDTLYSSITNEVKNNTANSFTLTNTFSAAVVCNAVLADINANNKLTTKEYVDSAVGGGSILGTNNTFIGTNIFNNNVDVSGNSTFNNFFPTSTLASGTAVTNDSIPNKGKNDTLYSSITNEVKNNTANSFTSTNSFNSFFPTSTLASGTAVTNDSIPNKGKNDTLYSTLANQVKSNTANTFTLTNTFSAAVVCNAVLADINANNKLTTKEYVDSVAGGGVTLAGTNVFTGSNTFLTNNIVSKTPLAKGAFVVINPNQVKVDDDNFVSPNNSNINIQKNLLTITNGSITQTGTTTNTMTNLQMLSTMSYVPTFSDQPTIVFTSVRMRTYLFHQRTNTTTCTITLSNDALTEDGQHLYVRKIGVINYAITIGLTAGQSMSFLNLSNTIVSTISMNTTTTRSEFIYHKTNKRWIQLF